MGNVYGGKCPLCGYEQQFFLGGGMMSINLEMSAGALPEDEQATLKRMKERQVIARFNVENFIVECPDCHKIMGKTIIEVEGKDGSRHIFGEHCDSCGKRLRIHWDNTEAELQCPKCQEGIIIFEEEGLWD